MQRKKKNTEEEANTEDDIEGESLSTMPRTRYIYESRGH
jgi:hypothetical protein